MAQATSVWIWPGFLGSPEDEPWARTDLPVLQAAWKRERIERLVTPRSGLAEAAWLGVDPSRVELAEGPLIAAAYRVEPPRKSVLFRVDVGSLDANAVIRRPDPSPTPTELKAISDALPRLASRRLTPVPGQDGIHLLVWEDGSLDLQTQPRAEAVGKSLRDALPEGDGESHLRRFIDDSVNLLDELEINHVRQEEGHLPLNLFWPWGQGRQEPTPDAARERGRPVAVATADLRLRGLTRRLGDWPVAAEAWRKGVFPDWRQWRTDSPVEVLHTDFWAQARTHQRFEEMAYAWEAWQTEWLEPRWAAGEHVVAVAALGEPHEEADGLLLTFDPERTPSENQVPFDERSLSERKLARRRLLEAVYELLRAPALD
jgi:hypothetical protein